MYDSRGYKIQRLLQQVSFAAAYLLPRYNGKYVVLILEDYSELSVPSAHWVSNKKQSLIKIVADDFFKPLSVRTLPGETVN